MAASLGNASRSAGLLVLLVSIAGAAILALMLVLWVKERMYETGVLLSIGENKLKVVGQYVTEVLCVAIVAFTVSIFSGQYVSQAVGDVLLDAQSSSPQTGQTLVVDGAGPGMFTRGDGAPAGLGGRGAQAYYQPVDSIDVSVGTRSVLKLFGAGLLIVLAASAVPALSVMRFNPKTILTKAN